MATLSCPNPAVTNPLQVTGFEFRIVKLPELIYWIKNIDLPSISLPETEQATPFIALPHIGDHPIYSSLNITFQLDEQMNNYQALHDWITQIGFDTDWRQVPRFRSQWKDNLKNNKDSDFGLTSDASLEIKSKNQETVRIIKFHDLWITELGSVTLSDENSDTVYATCTASFRLKGPFEISEYVS